MLNVTENISKEFCRPELILKLKEAGFKTDGSISELEEILNKNGFKLPGETNGGFGFILNKKFTRIFIHYVDALAGEILLLWEFKTIKPINE